MYVCMHIFVCLSHAFIISPTQNDNTTLASPLHYVVIYKIALWQFRTSMVGSQKLPSHLVLYINSKLVWFFSNSNSTSRESFLRYQVVDFNTSSTSSSSTISLFLTFLSAFSLMPSFFYFTSNPNKEFSAFFNHIATHRLLYAVLNYLFVVISK